MSISEEEVQKIAKLARLRLGADEVKLYQGQLLKILESMAELSALDAKDVAPTSSVLGDANRMRPDEPVSFPDREKLLGLAPEREGPFYKVPKVIE